MKLKMENYKKKGSFLDLGMKIKDNKFSIIVYDKRDGFPYLRRNISPMTYYSAFGAEILRIAGTANRFN